MVHDSSPTDMNEGSGHRDSLKWLQENSAVIIAILSVTIVAIRLLAVARGDPQIAYAILQAGGTGNVLIGTLVSALGLLAIPACAAFGFSSREAKKHSALKHVLVAAAFGMAYITIYAAPVVALASGVVLAVSGIIWDSRRKSESSWDGKKIFSFFTCVYIAVVVLYEVAYPVPWLPIQVISEAG
jgi:hypothetical protein